MEEHPTAESPATASPANVAAKPDAAPSARSTPSAGAATIAADVQRHEADDLGLLGSSHARSYMDIFCEGRPDDANIPADPRTLIQPGFNQGGAVAFNAYFQDCGAKGRPENCGQYRSQVIVGRQLIQQQLASTLFSTGIFPAAWYADAWKKWDEPSLKERPANFDEQARERYGLPRAPFDNPYPLPEEDPNQSHGGSGQLPAGLAQIREADGTWTGTIGMTCEVCHSSGIQALGEFGRTDYLSGMGPVNTDMQLLFTDMAAPVPIGMNDSRGTINGMGLAAVTVAILDQDSLGVRLDKLLPMQIPGNSSGCGDTKPSPWWNVSHRPRKMWDGGFSTNEMRADTLMLNAPSAFASPLGNDREFNHELRDKINGEGLVVQAYLE